MVSWRGGACRGHTKHGFLISWSPRGTKVPNKIQKQNAKWVKRLNQRWFLFFQQLQLQSLKWYYLPKRKHMKKKSCRSIVRNTQWHSSILLGLKFKRVLTKETIVMNLSTYRYTYVRYMHMHICTEHNNQSFGVQMTSSTTRRTCLWWWWWSVSSHPSHVLPGRFYRGLHEQKSPGFHAEKPYVSGCFVEKRTNKNSHPPTFQEILPWESTVKFPAKHTMGLIPAIV